MRGSPGVGRLVVASVALAASVVAGCGAGASPVPTTSDCPADIRAPGTFPDLEALVPRSLEGRSPTTVDSGANCTDRTLGTYRMHGIGELQYGGATWDEGAGNGTVIAVMFARPVGQPTIRAAWVEEFYESGARRSSKTENIEVTRPALGGAGTAYRLDTLNDLSLQTVVVWPGMSALGDVVHVVIVATAVNPDASRAEHDRRVDAAVAAAVGTAAPAPTPEPTSAVAT